jgi:hypothetical protein
MTSNHEINTVSRKRASQRSVRRNISLPPQLDSQAELLAQRFAFPSFSDYIQARMRKDLGLDLAA